MCLREPCLRMSNADVVHSYEHHSIDEPAILLGGGFIVDVAEDVKKNLEMIVRGCHNVRY
jgi:hypothetical protein